MTKRKNVKKEKGVKRKEERGENREKGRKTKLRKMGKKNNMCPVIIK